MANVGPIQIFTQLSNQATLPELVRFVSAFTGQIASQFNNLLSTRTISGAVGSSGFRLVGTGFSSSLIDLSGTYFLSFEPSFRTRPSVVVTAEGNANAYIVPPTTSGCTVVLGARFGFSFIARGDN